MRIFQTILDAFRLLDRPLRVRAGLSLLASLAIASLEMCSVFLVYPLVLAMVGGETTKRIPLLADLVAVLPQENRVGIVAQLIVGLMVAKSIISVALTWWQQGFVHRGGAIMAGRLLETYMAAPLLWHYTKNSAELQRNVNVSIRQVFSNIILASLATASELIVLGLMCTILIVVEPMAVLTAGGVFALSLLVYQRFLSALPRAAGRLLEAEGSQVIKHLNQALGATRELRLNGRERQVTAKFMAHKVAQAEAFRMIGTLAVVPRAYLELTVTIVLVAAVVWMSGLSQGTTVVATLGLFGAAILRMLPSIQRILSQTQQIQVGAASLHNVKRDIETLVHQQMPVHDAPKVSCRREIQICNLTFTYPGSARPAVSNVSVTIHRGDCIGIVGSSGAGKSTLIDLILGLVVPQQGAVIADGEDVTGQPWRWRGVVGYVPQSVFLLDDTLRRNIAFGLADGDIDDAEVRRVVKAAQLEVFASSLPNGLEAIIGENGVRLSGGQRQRIGIARALYGDPSVLIMDEGTSALDNETEERVTSAIQVLRGEKTILLVAHRLSTVQHSDSILFMQNGSVVDQGSFVELTARHPDFARLVEIADLGRARRAAIGG